MGGVGGFKCTCKGLFTGTVVNQLSKLDPYNRGPAVPTGNHPRSHARCHFAEPLRERRLMLGDRNLVVMRSLTSGAAYSESTWTAFSHFVEKRQKQVSPAYHATARSLDTELDSQPGSPGPVESELNTYN